MKDFLKQTSEPQSHRLLLAFWLFTYFYLEAEIVFMNRIIEGLDADAGTIFYCLFCFAAAAGYFSFAFIRKLTTKSEAFFRVALTGVCVFCTMASAFTGVLLTAVFTLLAMLTAGIVGASLLYSMAITVKEKSVLGRFIALPYAGAFLLQYIIDSATPVFGENEALFHHIFLASAFCAVFVLAPGDMGTVVQKQILQPGVKTETEAEAKRYLKGALVAGLIIFCLFGILDGAMMTLHAGQQINIYSWIRLIAIPGLFCTGLAADYRDGRYFPFASAIGMAASIAAVFLFHTTETFNASLGSVYFFSSFMTMYSLVVFVRAADTTQSPAFWAAAGRGLKYLAGSVFALTSSFLFANVNLILIALIYLALLIVLFVVFFLQGKLTPGDTAITAGQQPGIALEDQIKAYGFTIRETDVLRLLLDGKNTPEIARALVVTEHTVQKYISSMMSKSRSESRSILITKFTGRKV